jgi:hypothetical protein
MAINVATVIDGLTNLTWAISKDRKLRQWFDGLAKKSVWDRRNAVYAMCEKIASEGMGPDLVAAFRLLANPKVFDAACNALYESRNT